MKINRRIIIVSAVVVLLAASAAGGYFYFRDTDPKPLCQDGIVSTLDVIGDGGGILAFRGTIKRVSWDAPPRVYWFFYGEGKKGENAVFPDGIQTMSMYAGLGGSERSLTPRMISQGWSKLGPDGDPCHGKELFPGFEEAVMYTGFFELRSGYDHYWLWVFDNKGNLLHKHKFS